MRLLGTASHGNEMTEKLRVGVVGTGIGAAYIAGFQRQPGVEVASICARNPAHSEPLVKKYQIPRSFTDFKTMLAQEELDIVVIATPNYLHYPMAMAALDTGHHVLCDKPLALNSVQAREMAQHADELGRKHFVAFTWQFLPAAAYMKEILGTGFLGRLYHVNVQYFVRTWADPALPMRWQLERAQAGSGSLANLGSHAIHLLHWWFGGFRRVCGMLTTFVKERSSGTAGGSVPVEVDDACGFLGELENGAGVVFNTSSVAWVRHVYMQIGLFGSEGSLILEDDWGDADAMTGRIFAMRKNDPARSIVPIPARLTGDFLDMPDYYTPFRTCFSRMANEFVNAIREDRPACPNFHHGFQVQEVIDALLRSATEGNWTPLPALTSSRQTSAQLG